MAVERRTGFAFYLVHAGVYRTVLTCAQPADNEAKVIFRQTGHDDGASVPSPGSERQQLGAEPRAAQPERRLFKGHPPRTGLV